MKSKQEVKRKIASITKIGKLTKVMKIVSIMKFKKLSRRTIYSSEIVSDLEKTLALLAADSKLASLAAEKSEKTLWFVFGSDLGLCGSYNSRVLRLSEEEIRSGDSFVVFGRRMIGLFKFKGRKPVFEAPTERLNSSSFEELIQIVNEGFPEKWDRFGILSARLKERTPVFEKRILFSASFAEASPEEETKFDVSIESDSETLSKRLIGIALRTLLPELHVQARFAEESMRRSSLEKASESADNLVSELQLKYNQLRQETITQELLMSRK